MRRNRGVNDRYVGRASHPVSAQQVSCLREGSMEGRMTGNLVGCFSPNVRQLTSWAGRSENNWWERSDLSWSIIQRNRNNLLNPSHSSSFRKFNKIMKKSKLVKMRQAQCFIPSRIHWSNHSSQYYRQCSLLGMWSWLSEIWYLCWKHLSSNKIYLSLETSDNNYSQ